MLDHSTSTASMKSYRVYPVVRFVTKSFQFKWFVSSKFMIECLAGEQACITRLGVTQKTTPVSGNHWPKQKNTQKHPQGARVNSQESRQAQASNHKNQQHKAKPKARKQQQEATRAHHKSQKHPTRNPPTQPTATHRLCMALQGAHLSKIPIWQCRSRIV